MSSTAEIRNSHRLGNSPFWLWLGGASLSSLGTQILGFAIAWAASGYGGIFAGLVLTAINLPRSVLLIFGGSVVDRWGSLVTMLVGDIVMLMVAGGFAMSLLFGDSNQWQLILVSLLIGTVDAFYLPAAGTMPRLLVPEHQLPHAMSARQMSAQLASVIGGPLGAAIMTSYGLAMAALIDSATFAMMFIVLLVIRTKGSAPTIQVPPRPSSTSQGPWHNALEGFRICFTDPVLRPGLIMLIGTAAFLLPVMSLLLPLFAHDIGWTAQLTGWVLGSSATGAILIALWVLLTGGSHRPGIAGCVGLIMGSAGILVMALGVSALAPLLGSLFYGVGLGLFTTHIGPLLLGSAPMTHLGRVQAVLALAQSLPLLLSNLMLGAAAEYFDAPVALVICAGAIALIALLTLGNQPIRNVRKVTAEQANH